MLQMIHRFSNAVRTHTSILLCFALAGSLLAGCGSKSAQTPEQASSISTESAAPLSEEKVQAPAGERTVKDEAGHDVKLPAAPKRIFAPYLEDSLLKLGIKPVAQWSNGNMGHDYLQEELKDIPKLDLSGGLPSPEVLMSYNPDLIILHTSNYDKDGLYDNYSKIAPVYVFKNASGNVEESLVKLGELLGKSAEADTAIQAYQQKVKDAKQKLDLTIGGKKAAIIRFAKRGISLMGGNYFCGYAVYQNLGIGKPKLLGEENSANISMEVLPDLDADYIFIINAYGQGTEQIKEMEKSPIWKAIPAVNQGQVYEVSDKHWLGSGLIAYEKIIDDTVSLLAK